MSRRILVSGASIAGNTAAWWLGRLGNDVTVVERVPRFRDGGQNIMCVASDARSCAA